jgi:uncharacterized protein (TIGR03435 family)
MGKLDVVLRRRGLGVPLQALRLSRYALLVRLAACAAAAQDPRFEVISIRPVPANAPSAMRSQDFTPVLPGGQYVDSNAGLISMIAFAYGVPFPSQQLIGLPKWADSTSYSVAAKAAPSAVVMSVAENEEQVRLMMRALLADRFQLLIHPETRQERGFALKLARGASGIKIPAVDPPVPPAKERRVSAGMGDTGGRLVGEKSTMASLATALATLLHKNVTDQTGLSGYYDFDIRWTGREDAESSLGTEGIGLLISNLREQFGLTLESAEGPAQYWVIDRLERPSEN